MGHDAGAERPERPADGEQLLARRIHAAAMLAAIDLDQHAVADAGGARMRGDGCRGLGVIGYDLEIDAVAAQRCGAVELRRNDPDGVEDVAEAGGGEILDLSQRRDGDAARLTRRGKPRHLGAFRGLHVRAQRDAAMPRDG